MNRTSGGVEIRDTSMRMHFTVEGTRYRPTLMIDGEALPPTPANIKYANRLIIEICERIRTGTFSMMEYFPDSDEVGASTELTVEAWLLRWLKMTRVETSTRRGYVGGVKFWSRARCDAKDRPMGTLALRSLKLSHILMAIAGRPELCGKTINNYVSVLRQALALAVTEKLLPTNLAEGVPRAKHQRQPANPFSRDESEAIIAEAALIEPQIHNYIEFWFWSGLRTSKMNGLDWRYVDFYGDVISIERVLVCGEEKDRTKTSEARLVRLNSRSRAALQRQRAITALAGGRVFQDPRHGKPWHSEEAFLRVYWSRILKRLGIRYRRPYNMRHSYATSMLMAGMTPAFCAKQLGHTVEMFLRIYTKWIDGNQNDLEMARLESALGVSVATAGGSASPYSR